MSSFIAHYTTIIEPHLGEEWENRGGGGGGGGGGEQKDSFDSQTITFMAFQ